MKYKLLWEENFTTKNLDDNYWNIEEGGKGFGNKEAQYYTKEAKNIFIENNILNIVAYKEKYQDHHYTSAKITTYGKISMQYGKLIVSAKLPHGQGVWPAIWMLPNSLREGDKWPECGEIDIMEHVGRDPYKIHFSIHTGNKNHKLDNHETVVVENKNIYDDFIDYEIRWDSESISFYIGKKFQTTFYKQSNKKSDWPFDNPFYLIINLAIGGTFGGNIDDNIFPVKLQIKNIKFYEQKA